MPDLNKIEEIKPEMPILNLQEKVQGKNIFHAPQQVTAPTGTPTWVTSGSGTGSPFLSGSNATALAAMYKTMNDIYKALLKEGLIKKK